MKIQPFSGFTFAVALRLFGISGLVLTETLLAAQNDARPTIIVQIYNYSPASPEIVASAEREAGRILIASGLQPDWMECPVAPRPLESGPCQSALQATDLRLRILPVSVQNKYQDSVFGFAVHPALASVYYDYAQRRAKVDDAEFELPVILGGVMAHELGHLLLGSNGHSATGIMQPRWDPSQIRLLMMGDLQFTPEQMKLMIKGAQARTEQRNNLSSTSVNPQH